MGAAQKAGTARPSMRTVVKWPLSNSFNCFLNVVHSVCCSMRLRPLILRIAHHRALPPSIRARAFRSPPHTPYATSSVGPAAVHPCPIYLTGSAIVARHPGRARAGVQTHRVLYVSSVFRGCRLRRLQPRPRRQLPMLQIPPQRHQQLARERHNPDAPRARSPHAEALRKPLR